MTRFVFIIHKIIHTGRPVQPLCIPQLEYDHAGAGRAQSLGHSRSCVKVSRGAAVPAGLSVLTSLMVSVDVKQH